MPLHPSPAEARQAAGMRSGAAARLAGLPVTTLRVWERRYAVVAAPKTPTGQRLYSQHDVQRLRLLKQLTDGGHAIGTVALLTLEALHALAGGLPSPAPREPAPNPSLVVVGRIAAQKLTAIWGCNVQAVHAGLDEAEADPALGTADVLLVHLPSLQPATAQRVLALGARLCARSVIVIYAFGAQAVVAALEAAGATARREPVMPRELEQLVSPPSQSGLPVPAGWQAAPRRFSDEALAELAQRTTSVACECPRHLAELVLQLSSFERYSADCLAGNVADAALHLQLSGLAACARTRFEQALEQVVVERALDRPAPGAAPDLQRPQNELPPQASGKTA